jgi:hypothetical protein
MPLQQPAYVPPPVYPQHQAPPSYSSGYTQGYGASASGDGSSKGLVIGLSIGGGVLALLLVIGVVVIVSFNRGTPVAQKPTDPVGAVQGPPSSNASVAPVPGLLAPGATGTPFSSSPSGASAVRQLPIVGADAALAYRWAPDKNYDYDYQLDATVDATRNTYIGSASYKLNPRTTERLARLAGIDGPQEGWAAGDMRPCGAGFHQGKRHRRRKNVPRRRRWGGRPA